MMKSIFASRTFWLNLIAAGAAIAEILTDILPAEWQPYVIAAYGVANIILRFDTTKPVRFRAQK